MDDLLYVLLIIAIIVIIYCSKNKENDKEHFYIDPISREGYIYNELYPPPFHDTCMETLLAGTQCFDPIIWPFYYW